MKRIVSGTCLTAFALLLATIGSARAEAGASESGLSAVYNTRLQGHRTASGERYDKNALTTAHKSLPFGTKVRITRADNGKSVVVRVNDRGPTQPGRVVDISSAAAKKIGLSGRRMTEVKLEVVAAAPAKAVKTAHHDARAAGH